MIACTFAAALSHWQGELRLEMSEGATVADVLQAVRAQIGEFADDAFWTSAPVGIFGELCERDRRIVEGDRIEIYRPLQADPMESRRRRARHKAAARG